MAYFEKNSDGNFDYSYYGVNDTILGEYVDPGRIQAIPTTTAASRKPLKPTA